MDIIPDHIHPDNQALAEALAAGVHGADLQEQAAVALLLHIPYGLYARGDVLDRAILCQPADRAEGIPATAHVTWSALARDVQSQAIPMSSGEQAAVSIAADLYEHLGDRITRLDAPLRRAVAAAVCHACGVDPAELAAGSAGPVAARVIPARQWTRGMRYACWPYGPALRSLAELHGADPAAVRWSTGLPAWAGDDTPLVIRDDERPEADDRPEGDGSRHAGYADAAATLRDLGAVLVALANNPALDGAPAPRMYLRVHPAPSGQPGDTHQALVDVVTSFLAGDAPVTVTRQRYETGQIYAATVALSARMQLVVQAAIPGPEEGLRAEVARLRAELAERDKTAATVGDEAGWLARRTAHAGAADDRPEGDGTEPVPPGVDGHPVGRGTQTCIRCHAAPADRLCCSSHNALLCHGCYRRTHYVEVCVPGCEACAREGLDPGQAVTR